MTRWSNHYPLVNSLVDPENYPFLVKTYLPTPGPARVYVNLLVDIYIYNDIYIYIIEYIYIISYYIIWYIYIYVYLNYNDSFTWVIFGHFGIVTPANEASNYWIIPRPSKYLWECGFGLKMLYIYIIIYDNHSAFSIFGVFVGSRCMYMYKWWYNRQEFTLAMP